MLIQLFEQNNLKLLVCIQKGDERDILNSYPVIFYIFKNYDFRIF